MLHHFTTRISSNNACYINSRQEFFLIRLLVIEIPPDTAKITTLSLDLLQKFLYIPFFLFHLWFGHIDLLFLYSIVFWRKQQLSMIKALFWCNNFSLRMLRPIIYQLHWSIYVRHNQFISKSRNRSAYS